MKYLKLFEDKYKKEAEPNDIFGAYLFADQRKGMKGLEPNNYKEDVFLDDLKKHYNNVGYLNQWIPKMRELKNQKKYKDILTPPKGKVWRLLTGVNDTTIQKMLSMRKQELRNHENDFYKISNMIIKPKSDKIQSWTYSLQYKTFENLFIENTDNIVILEAYTQNKNNDFFLNHENIRKIDDMPEYVKKEYETISYGDVHCSNVYFWISPSDKTFSSIDRQIDKIENDISIISDKIKYNFDKSKSEDMKSKLKELKKFLSELKKQRDYHFNHDRNDIIKKFIRIVK